MIIEFSNCQLIPKLLKLTPVKQQRPYENSFKWLLPRHSSYEIALPVHLGCPKHIYFYSSSFYTEQVQYIFFYVITEHICNIYITMSINLRMAVVLWISKVHQAFILYGIPLLYEDCKPLSMNSHTDFMSITLRFSNKGCGKTLLPCFAMEGPMPM